MRPSGLLVATSTMVTSSPVLLVTYSFWRTGAGSAAKAAEDRVSNASVRQLQRVSTATPPGDCGESAGGTEDYAAQRSGSKWDRKGKEARRGRCSLRRPRRGGQSNRLEHETGIAAAETEGVGH